MNSLKRLAAKYRLHFSDRRFVISFVTSLLLLFGSFVVNFYAGVYATEKASNAVTDLILNNIPVFNVDDLFLYGPVVLWVFAGALVFSEPKRLPFVLKSIAVFILIRSVFITLTHIGPFPDQLNVDYTSDFAKKFTFGGDLFFSGHTGLPFLMALIFWRNRLWRSLFIISSLFFGAVVLMAHLHYSIDVLSAFFITFTIFHLACWLFPKDWHLFQST